MDDFAKLQMNGGIAHEPWALDFAQQQQQQQPPGRTASWNQIWNDTAGPSNEWATEFGKAEAATVCCPCMSHLVISSAVCILYILGRRSSSEWN